MYRIFSNKILCENKVVSPFIHLLHSVVQMCTVGPWSPLSPRDSKPREVVQLDGTIGTVCGKHSSIQLSEPVGKTPLGATGRNKAEAGQHCLIFSKRTMLYFQCHRFYELAGCSEPEDGAEEFWILRKLKLSKQTCSDVDPALFHVSWKAVFRKMNSQSIPLPLKWASFSWNCELCFSYHFYSTNVAWEMCMHSFMIATDSKRGPRTILIHVMFTYAWPTSLLCTGSFTLCLDSHLLDIRTSLDSHLLVIWLDLNTYISGIWLGL